MRAYVRTSRRTGVSMPWPLALIVGACALVIWLMVLFYGLAAMAVIWVVRGGVRGVRAWRARRR